MREIEKERGTLRDTERNRNRQRERERARKRLRLKRKKQCTEYEEKKNMIRVKVHLAFI